MARLGVHPRFAHMVLQGRRLGCPELACVLASLLSERDVLRGRDVRTADVGLRLRALAAGDAALDRATSSRILESARKMLGQLARQGSGEGPAPELADDSAVAAATQDLDEAGGGEAEEEGEGGEEGGEESESDQAAAAPAAAAAVAGGGAPQLRRWVEQLQRDALVGVLLALAYPDRIAQRAQRGSSRATYTLSAGRNARLLAADDPLQLSEFIAIAELGGGRDGRNDVVQLAAGLSKSAIDRCAAVQGGGGREQGRLGRVLLVARTCGPGTTSAGARRCRLPYSLFPSPAPDLQPAPGTSPCRWPALSLRTAARAGTWPTCRWSATACSGPLPASRCWGGGSGGWARWC
jgi:hypothetical protein